MKRPSTPGEILKEEFMKPYGLSAQTLAEKSMVSASIISRIINNKTIVTVPVAIKLGKLFGNPSDFWLTLQMEVDKYDAHQDIKLQKEINQVIELHNPIDRE